MRKGVAYARPFFQLCFLFERTFVNGKPVVSTRWTNGTVQSSTENFVFIIFTLNDRGLLTIENAYFGRLSYKEFKLKCKNGMRISENMVKELCVKII